VFVYVHACVGAGRRSRRRGVVGFGCASVH